MKTLFSVMGPAAVGVAMVSLPIGAGVAVAEPDLGPMVNTTCSYEQVVSAANAQSPLAAAFMSSPLQEAGLRQFLASPRAERQQMAVQITSTPGNQQNLGILQQIFNTCTNY